jgi:hypothetical protein
VFADTASAPWQALVIAPGAVIEAVMASSPGPAVRRARVEQA